MGALSHSRYLIICEDVICITLTTRRTRVPRPEIDCLKLENHIAMGSIYGPALLHLKLMEGCSITELWRVISEVFRIV